jgi:hypothetical protein
MSIFLGNKCQLFPGGGTYDEGRSKPEKRRIKMKKQQDLQLIIPGLILVTLLLAIVYSLLALQIELPVLVVNQNDQSPSNFKDSGDLLAYRWVAMAKAYEKANMLNHRLDAGELSAYRWNAMAEAYQRMGLLNYHDNPDDLMAYRWNAMAEAYQRMGLLNYHDNPDDLMAYRWNAMAEAYQRMGLLNLP